MVQWLAHPFNKIRVAVRHMQKTTFHIKKMDCPSEENLIRMKLSSIPSIKHLDFDIPKRQLTIFHTKPDSEIENKIHELNLSSELLNTTETNQLEFNENANQRKLLWAVLIINFSFFLIEITTGIVSKSMGLVADSLDMLADAFVYGISLLAVGGTISRKKSIAKIAGIFQIVLACIGFMEIVRRFISGEQLPEFGTMIIVSVLALLANAYCLYLLQKSKSKEEAHMQASMIFTSNDIIINFGVIIAGVLVYITDTRFPDLIVGAIVFILVLQGALRILKLSN